MDQNQFVNPTNISPNNLHLPKPPLNRPIQIPTFIKRLVPVCLTLGILIALISYLNTNPQNSPSKSVNQIAQVPQQPQTSSSTTKSIFETKVLPAETENLYRLVINIESTNSGKIKGNFNIKNPTPNNLTDLHYIITLDKPLVSNSSVITRLQSNAFNLDPSQQKNFTFELDFPTTIQTGEYDLKLNIIAKSGSILYTAYKPLQLQGSNTLLSVNNSNCKIIADNKEFNDPIIAPPLNPNSTPIARCIVTNPTNSQKTLKPIISYGVQYAMLSPNPQTQFNSNQTFTLSPNQTTQIDINLPALAKPQVYEAIAQLADASTNQIESGYLILRWTIRGPSANISKSTLDKDYYKAGEVATIDLIAAPSLDLWWRDSTISGSQNEGTILKSPQVEIKITSGNQLCGQTTKNLPPKDSLDPWHETIKIDIAKDCLNPKIETKVLDDSEVLAAFDQEYKTALQNIKQPDLKQKLVLSQIIKIILIAILIVTIIAITFWLYKRSKQSPPKGLTPLLIFIFSLIISGILLVNPLNILADIVGPTGPTGSSFGAHFWYTSPQDTTNQGLRISKVTSISPDTLEITVSGNLFNYSCGNSGVVLYVENYIDNQESDIEVLYPFTYSSRRVYPGAKVGKTNSAFHLESHNGGPDVNYEVVYQLRKNNGFGGGPHSLKINFLTEVGFTSGTSFSEHTGEVIQQIPGGFFDTADNNSCTISGWSLQFPSSQTNVEIYTGSSTSVNPNGGIGSFLADKSRPDLGGNYGFVENLQNYIGDGNQRYLWMYGVTTSGERLYTQLGNTPKPISCQRRSGPSVSVTSACTQSGTTANISWGSINPAVFYVDISTDPNFNSFANKYVPNQTSTDTTGFSNNFTLQPNTTYYVRTWNGWVHSANTSFTTPPVCVTPTPTRTPTPIPTATPTPTPIPTSTPTPTPVPNLSISCNASPQVGTVGQAINWTSAPSGGTGSYSYFWSGAINGSFPAGSTSYSSEGYKTANLTVTSGTQTATTSCTTYIYPTQPPPPSVTLPSCVNNGYNGSGISITWRNTETPVTWVDIDTNTGNGYYHKAVPQSQQTPNGWATIDAANFTWYTNNDLLTFNPRSTYRVRLYNGTHSPLVYFVTPYSCLSNVFCSGSPNPQNINQPVNWSSSASGGSGSYSYSWSGTDNLSGNTQTVSKSYNSSGNKTANLTISSSDGQVQSSGCSVAINIPPLQASCSVNPASATSGQSVTWSSQVSGGIGGYTYNWSGTDNLSGNSSTISRAYQTAGTKTGSVRINSGSQSITQSCTNSLTINAAPPQSPFVTLPGCTNPGYNGSGIVITWLNNDNPVTWVDIDTNTGNGYYHKAVPQSQQRTNNWSSIDATGFTWFSDSTVLTFNPRSTYRVRLYNGTHSPLVYFVTPYSCLQASCVGNPNPVSTNQTANWTSNVIGGSGNNTYIWSNDANDTRQSTSYAVYNTPGNKRADLRVNSSDGQTTQTSCTISAENPPQLTLSIPTCTQVNNNGSNINLSWNNNSSPVSWANIDNDNDWNNGYYQKSVPNGTTSINATGFTWYNNNNVIQFNPNTTYYVRLYNGTHTPTQNFRMEQCLSVQCSVNPATIQPNQSVTWTATTTGGDGTNRYTYTWTGDENLSAGPTSDGPTNSVSKTYTTTGQKSATVRVQTPSQNISQSCFNQTNVNFSPFLQTKEGDVHTNTQIDSPGGPR